MAPGGRAKTAPAIEVNRAADRADNAAPAPRPFKPRRRLLAALSVLFAAWMAFLVVLYFTTIYPRRPVAPGDGASHAIAAPHPVHSNS